MLCPRPACPRVAHHGPSSQTDIAHLTAEAKSICPINPSKVQIVTGGRAAVSEVRELGLVSVGLRGQWPPHHRRDERRSEGAKEASNFEHTWLIYKHPILIRPRASVRVRPARRAEGTSEYSSQPFFERRRRRELAICPAGAGGTHFRNERDRPDDARYEIAFSKAGR